MRLTALITTTMVLGVAGCKTDVSDAAFCGPDFTQAIQRLATALPDAETPNAVGQAGTAVVLAHDAGCA